MKPRIIILAVVALAALLQAAISIGQTKVNSRTAGFIPGGVTTQAANPPYLREMPSAERVKAEIKGTDAMDTAARQMGAFWQLQQILKELSGLRWVRNELTPLEKRLLGEYSGGYQSAGQPYASYPDRPKWYKMHSFYEVDDAFREDLFKRFFSPEFRAQYFKTKGETEATVKARKEARAQALREEQEQIARAQASFGQQQPPEWKRQLARCLASGRSESQCFAEQLGNDFQKMFPIAKNKERPAGLTMSGVYGVQGGASVTFAPTGAVVACKGVAAQANYAVQREGDQIRIRLLQPSPADLLGFGSEMMEKLVPKNPSPNEWQGQQIVFPLRADGKLAASGTIRVTGPVKVGETTQQTTETREKMVSAAEARQYNSVDVRRTAAGGFYVNVEEPVTRTVPVYESRTMTCPLGTLSPTGKMPLVGASMSTSMATAFELMFGNLTPEASVKVPDPGLRMNGRYLGQAGLDIEFHPESAVVSCRQAVLARDYSVSTTGGKVLVNIQHSPNPIALELRPDGTLIGSGPVQVNGRVWAGSNANNEPIFQPTTDTCALGVLTPTQPGSAGTAAPPATGGATTPVRPPDAPTSTPPTGPGASAVLSLASGFAAQPGASSPLAGKTMVLLKESFEDALRKAGFQPTPGKSAIKLWATACANSQLACQQVLALGMATSVAVVKIDASGRAQFPAVPAGTYYVFGSTRYNNQAFLWDVRVDLKPGANAVTLDQRNSARIE